MTNQNFCNGCKKNNLQDLNFDKLQICKNCLLVSRKIEKKFFSRIKKIFKTNKGYSWNLKDLKNRSKINFYFFNKILKFTQIKKKDQILDLGSGYGPLLHILKQKNYSAIGVEPSLKNSKISKKLGHKVINNILKKNTFKDKKFKVIVSLYVFTYIHDLADNFNIFRKILKDDGYILLRIHQYKFSKTYWQRDHFKILGKKVTNHFSNNSLKNLFNFHNFDIVLFEPNLDGTTIIAKKVKKKKYKMIGNYKFEIFYLNYLLFYVSNIMLGLYKIKIKVRNLFYKLKY